MVILKTYGPSIFANSPNFDFFFFFFCDSIYRSTLYMYTPTIINKPPKNQVLLSHYALYYYCYPQKNRTICSVSCHWPLCIWNCTEGLKLCFNQWFRIRLWLPIYRFILKLPFQVTLAILCSCNRGPKTNIPYWICTYPASSEYKLSVG